MLLGAPMEPDFCFLSCLSCCISYVEFYKNNVEATDVGPDGCSCSDCSTTALYAALRCRLLPALPDSRSD